MRVPTIITDEPSFTFSENSIVNPAISPDPFGPSASTIVPAAHGYSFRVSKGTRFRIIDIHGE